MPQSLREYLDALDERNLVWPEPPAPKPWPAKPTLKPLPGVRAVTWTVYGTLLTIHDGELLHLHPESLRNQIALEKTIEEFNMWYSMSRRPGQPWEYMLQQYDHLLKVFQMAGTKHKGDFPHVDSARLWARLIERLQQKEYTWDRAAYGDEAEYAVKVAYFFHASLQGVRAAPQAAETILRLQQAGIAQGILADTQAFTMAQLLHALDRQSRQAVRENMFLPALSTESHRLGIRKPSPTMYEWAARQAERAGYAPHEVLHVSHRLTDDLSLAREFGFRTALYVGDRQACRVTVEELNNPDHKPDRMITQLSHVLDLAGV